MAKAKAGPSPRKTPAKAQTKSGAPRQAAAGGETAGLIPGLGFPVVAIGASAGGLAAFTELLKALPANSGMAFVLIQHLEPTHESALTALLSKATSMRVVEVSEGMAVERNHVYVIPPNKNMTIRQGTLRLAPRSDGSGPQRPIDDFSIALAEEQGDGAIGVVLSGTGSDGTYGLKAIKAAGGVTFAQEPKTAQWAAMPMSAISAGSVDFVLSPKRIAAELTRIGRYPYLAAARDVPDGSDLDKVCLILRSAMGVDFRLYKQATVRRRMARRMALHKISSLGKYAQILKQNRDEAQALADDIFIHVTGFFRDPECFQALRKQVVAKLALRKTVDDPIRIWVAGCSTGEEVYSVAMLLMEELGERVSRTKIQIFGTDIQERAVEQARAGIYTEAAIAHVSPTRLKRFFVKGDHGYQIQKAIRDLCVFARHDLARDPPFSRLDLISCRNVLIYMGAPLQKRILSVFQYALKPGGFLFLGNSESISDYYEAFEVEDQKHRIFLRKTGPTAFHQFRPAADYSQDPQVAASRIAPPVVGTDFRKEAEMLLLKDYSPPGIVVDSNLHIVHFQGDTSAYLAPATGQPSFHLLKMVRPELVVDLRTAIDKARRDGGMVRKDNVQFTDEGKPAAVRIEVRPLKKSNGKKSDLLIVFQKLDPARPEEDRKKGAPADKRASEKTAALDRELSAAREQLRSLIAEHETAQEEMKAANEEILSSNEELQSTNEELETAKEELQSANEELVTLNDELQHQNTELTVLTHDLSNLLVGVDIPVLVLDADLRVRRFTPVAGSLLNLIPGDVGRPFSDLANNLDVEDWNQVFSEVIDQGELLEREVRDRGGHRYSMRVRPYKTSDRRIEGVLLVLLDVDLVYRARDDAERSRDYSRAIFETIHEALVVMDFEFRILTTNRSFSDMFGLASEDAEGQSLFELGDGAWNVPSLRELFEKILPQGRAIKNFEIDREFAGVGRRRLVIDARRIEASKTILLAIDDVTERKEAEEAARSNQIAIQALMEATAQSIVAVNAAGNIVLTNGSTERMFGYTREELLGKPLEILVPEDFQGRHLGFHQKYFAEMKSRPMGMDLELEGCRKDGTRFPVEIGLGVIEVAQGKLGVAFVTDISHRKRSEEALYDSEERLRLAIGSTGLGTFDRNAITGTAVWSGTAKRHYGLPPEAEVTTDIFYQALHPEDSARIRRALEEIRPEGSGQFALEYRTLGIADGKERWISALGKVFFNSEGKAERFLGMTLDITERKRMEEALRQREREVRTVLEATPDAVMRLDRRFRYTYVNAKTASISGIPPEAFLGKTPAELGFPQELVDRWFRTFRRAVETKKTGNVEFTYAFPGGESDWDEQFVPEFATDGSVESVLVIGHDVTERNRLQKVAEASHKEVQALAASLLTAQEEERRRVARELHDQICQQLASLAIDLGAFAAGPPPINRERRLKELQARVIKASEETRHIAYELHPSVLDDLGLVASLRELCNQFSEGNLSTVLKFSGDSLPAPVPREVASCLYRIAQESLQNIAHHSHAKHVTVALGFDKKAVKLTVTDDGSGFDLQAVKGRGGLGLIGAEERARLVRGKLSIVTAPGRGTRVSIEVPLSVDEV